MIVFVRLEDEKAAVVVSSSPKINARSPDRLAASSSPSREREMRFWDFPERILIRPSSSRRGEKRSPSIARRANSKYRVTRRV